ncbi:hypothetical protein JAVIER_169 [Vibrio phage Javier]|nr:hypothetical protein JAVIER_169 [Vibrio phage Javier]
MKKFLVLMAAVLSFNAFAGSCAQQVGNISGLDQATKQTMIIQCEQAKLTSIQKAPQEVGEISDATVEKMDKWSEISLKFAKAIGVAAKEVGVATNEFLGTPAGKFTATIIAWKIFNGTSWLAFFLILAITTIIIRSFIRFVRHSGYEEVSGKLFNYKRPTKYTWKEMDDNQVGMCVLAYIVYIVVVVFTAINLF